MASPRSGSTATADQLAKARFDALLAAAVDAIIVIGEDGHIQTFNPAAERIFGYDASEVLGRNVNIIMPEPFRSQHDGYVRRYLQSGIPRIIGVGRELEGLRKDGSVIPVDLSVGHARVGGENLFVGILRDLSEREEVQAALSESERAFATFMENCPGMAYRCENDEAWTMRFVSSGSLALTGHSPESFVAGQVAYADLIRPDDRLRVRATVDSALARREPFRLTYRIRTRSGRERSVFERGVGVFRQDAHRCSFIEGFIEDITERLDAEREADRLRESLAHVGRLGAMGEMATGIAHEINQPLTAIGNYAQACRFMLQKDTLDPQRLEEVLDKISRSAKRAGEVIHSLRSFVSKRDSEREPVQVNDLVADVVALMEVDVRLQHAEIRLDLAEALPLVVADRVQIQQVVLNLMRNGIDAMKGVAPPENRLSVKTRARQQSEVEVSVTDRGVGIPEGVDDELFRPFYTTKESGMGMGLSICRSIVEAHGGRLWFTRRPEGGTTFHFTLPTAIEEAIAP